ncbi:MAG: regulatory signaling modulator protein AmpE, partial [Gammaproteobacteria bacterium]|nr:regulatory signaling modulator protein AmpE [Gammaproteobacteria bacterium]
MIFIITLIALLMERFFHWHHLRHWYWFKRYERWLSARLNHLPVIILFFCNVLPPLVIVGLIGYFSERILYGIPQFIFGVIIILYCLGPENLWLQTYRCITALHRDDPTLAPQEVQTSFKVSAVEHSQLFHKKFIHAIFVAAHQRIFAVLFWFVILGPVGAVLYRMVDSYRTQSVSQLHFISMRIVCWMDWVSIRVFTFLFALGGHFTKVFVHWKLNVLKGVKVNDVLLTECGFAAIDVVNGGVIPEAGE